MVVYNAFGRFAVLLLCAVHLAACTTAPPVHQAIIDGDQDRAVALIREGADLEPWEGVPAIHRAAYLGQVRVIDALLEQGADINAAIETYGTPLHQAAMREDSDSAAFLLERGAELDARSSQGVTPLYEAAYRGHLHVAQVLLDAGADPDIATNSGFAPLHAAAEKRHADVVQLLLDYGADVHAQSLRAYTPLNQAFFSSNKPDDTTAALAAAGSTPNEVSDRPQVNAGTCWALASWNEEQGDHVRAAELYEAAADWFDKAAASAPAHITTSTGYRSPSFGEMMHGALMQHAFDRRDGGMYGALYAQQLQHRRQTGMRGGGTTSRPNPAVALWRQHAIECRERAQQLRGDAPSSETSTLDNLPSEAGEPGSGS